jgi:hypothetical protein
VYENSILIDYVTESPNVGGDDLAALFFLALFVSPFKSKSRLEAESAALRHQLIVLQRRVRSTHKWGSLVPGPAVSMVSIGPPGHHDHPALVRWHRAGFRRYWRRKSHSLGGRPKIAADLRALIRRTSAENPLWGAPRIHGELLKLGFEIAQSSVAKYMVKRCGPPSRGWRTFLRNHAPDMAAMGPVRCSDHWLRLALCLSSSSTRAPKPCLDQRQTQSSAKMGSLVFRPYSTPQK